MATSHWSLDNKEVNFHYMPEEKRDQKWTTLWQNTSLFTALSSILMYAAGLKMQAHSYFRFCCLWHLFICKRWCSYKTELPYPAHPAINRAFTDSFPWSFRSWAQTYNSLCLQENTTVECEVSGLIFPVLVDNCKGQGHWSAAEEVGLTTFQNTYSSIMLYQ